MPTCASVLTFSGFALSSCSLDSWSDQPSPSRSYSTWERVVTSLRRHCDISAGSGASHGRVRDTVRRRWDAPPSRRGQPQAGGLVTPESRDNSGFANRSRLTEALLTSRLQQAYGGRRSKSAASPPSGRRQEPGGGRGGGARTPTCSTVSLSLTLVVPMSSGRRACQHPFTILTIS
jgi:hypothetical protein